MKVVISAEGTDLDAAVSRNLSEGGNLLLVDGDTLAVEDLTSTVNEFAGPRFLIVTRLAARRGADAVISGRIGFPALPMLQAMGVAAYEYRGGSLRQAIEALKAGRLEPESLHGFGPSGEGIAEGMHGPHPHGHHAPFEHLHGHAREWRDMWGTRGRRFQEGAQGPGEAATASPSEEGGAGADLRALRQQAEQLQRQLDEVLKRVEQLENK
jgi:predicted Fe-Mo cluster-binding NifX family protein